MDAGFSGYADGGAKVSEKHCGFLINAGGATASDVMELIRQIQAKVKEAEQYAAEDKQRKEEVEVRNQAETLVYETEKNLKVIEGSLSDEEETAVNTAKEVLS